MSRQHSQNAAIEVISRSPGTRVIATIPRTVQARRCVVLAGGVLGRAGKSGLIPRVASNPTHGMMKNCLSKRPQDSPTHANDLAAARNR
jgi:hypothetical protein